MKKLILITASIGGCLILATALALPPGVMVREWSSHIVAGEVVPLEETRTTEEESEPEQQEEPEKPEELEADYIPEQPESQESSEEKEMLEKPEQVVSSPTDLFYLAPGNKR